MTDNTKMREALELWAKDKFAVGGRIHSHLIYGNTDWALAQYVWEQAWQAAQSVAVVGEPIYWIDPDDDANLSRISRVGWSPLYGESPASIPAAELARLRENAAEADKLRECKALLSEARKSMLQYDADYDEYPPFHHNKLMERIDAAIAQEGE